MGSGITASMRTQEQTADAELKSFHEPKLHSQRGHDLERILKSDRSASALLKYLDHNGKGCCLILFMVITQYKGVNELLLRQALNETRSRYEPLSYQDCESNFQWQEELYSIVKEILTIPMTSKNVKKLEEFCLLNMTHELQGFIDSREFSMRFSHKINRDSSLRTVCEITKELKSKYKNVLIIDDSPQNSRQMSYELKANGHSVRQANHGWIGTHIATLHHFDVILIDLAMNTMDPYDVIKRIKATKTKYNASPLVVGLNYSEYDLKSHGDVLFSINVGNLETSPKDFVTGFYKIISRCAELSRDKYETCDTSTTSSKLSVC